MMSSPKFIFPVVSGNDQTIVFTRADMLNLMYAGCMETGANGSGVKKARMIVYFEPEENHILSMYIDFPSFADARTACAMLGHDIETVYGQEGHLTRQTFFNADTSIVWTREFIRRAQAIQHTRDKTLSHIIFTRFIKADTKNISFTFPDESGATWPKLLAVFEEEQRNAYVKAAEARYAPDSPVVQGLAKKFKRDETCPIAHDDRGWYGL